MPVAGLLTGAAVLLTSANVPMLFQGEEWGARTPFQYFTAHEDENIARAVSEGRRSEFDSFDWGAQEVPDPQDRATFERSKLDWAELDREPHRDILEWHKALIRLRRSTPALLNGKPGVVEEEGAATLRIERGGVQVIARLERDRPCVEVAVVGDVVLSTGALQEAPRCIAGAA